MCRLQQFTFVSLFYCQQQQPFAATTQSSRQAWSPLAGLPPLPKPHHSWLSTDPTFANATDPLTRDVVRITGSCPVYACFGDRSSCHAPSHPCSNDTAGRAAVEACVALSAPVNATIAINYSPWYCVYRGNDPTARTKDALADTARELQLWSTNLGKIKSWLGGRVPVSAVLLDSEKFECTHPNPDGCSNQTVWAAMDEKHDLFFNATKAAFPHASVELFGHGGARFRGISAGSFSTTSTKFSLRERSDTFSVSLYGPSELGYTRETYARSVAVARDHNISTVTPWIALGAGYDEGTGIGGQRDFVNSLEYPLANSWMLGRDVNVPTPQAGMIANEMERHARGDWEFARYAVVFPDINNPPCEGGKAAAAAAVAPVPLLASGGTVHATVANSFKGCSKKIQDSTLALLHFTAFVLGANCIQELPNRTAATKYGFNWRHTKPGPARGGCYLKTDDSSSRTWSGLTLKPCDPAGSVKDAQFFKAPAVGGSGQVTDKETGRCLSVLDCKLPSEIASLAAAKMGVAVLDVCGGGMCAGLNQKWSRTAATAPAFEFISALQPSWKLMGTYRPAEVNNEDIVVQNVGPGNPNTEFTAVAPGADWTQLKIAPAPFYGSRCPTGTDCCLEALPCAAPCVLASGWGVAFIVVLVVSTTLYVGGGIAHAHKAKGEALALGNLRQLLPHVPQWLALAGLVADGCAFCKARWLAHRAGAPGAGCEDLTEGSSAVPAPAAPSCTQPQPKAQLNANPGPPAAPAADAGSDSDSNG
jgi:hypothetical protein